MEFLCNLCVDNVFLRQPYDEQHYRYLQDKLVRPWVRLNYHVQLNSKCLVNDLSKFEEPFLLARHNVVDYHSFRRKKLLEC